MAYSSSFTFNISAVVTDCNLGDNITFELISEYQPTNTNWTGSVPIYINGSTNNDYINVNLLNIGLGGYPYATSSYNSNGYIANCISPNYIQFNSQISQFYGGNYIQLPNYVSGSIISSSLYSAYGDVSYPFVLSQNDKIILYSYDGRTQIVSIKSVTYTYSSGSTLLIETYPNLNDYWITYPQNISKFLAVKRLQDEQNIIMTFAKPPGETSYGFIIPENIDLKILDSISSIQANVQNQLLSTQQNSQ